ncbi:MAG: hypothetical protein WCF08_10755, partial [Anaerolineaceae bacterium]
NEGHPERGFTHASDKQYCTTTYRTKLFDTYKNAPQSISGFARSYGKGNPRTIDGLVMNGKTTTPHTKWFHSIAYQEGL